MARHHYIPAAFLAMFSADKTSRPSRKRKLYVGDKNDQRVFPAKAEKVARINDLYGEELGTWPPVSLETVWQGYEGKLLSAIQDLVNGTVDAVTWTRVLVPFVSGLLIRGPDFDRRFERRLRAAGFESIMDQFVDQNTNGARLIEWNRLLAPVLASRWFISHVEGDTALVTNDLGFTLIGGDNPDERGLLVPLTDSCLLVLIPEMERIVLRAKGDTWEPQLVHETCPMPAGDINSAMANAAQRFLLGGDKETIQALVETTDTTWPPPEPVHVGFMDDRYMRAHELTWHRLAGVVETPPTELGDEIKFDTKLLTRGWGPPMNLALGLHRFPSALFRHGDEIVVQFYDPEYQYALAELMRLEAENDFNGMVEAATRGLSLSKTPDDAKTMWLARATALLELQMLTEALDDLNKCLALDPTSIRALTTKTNALLQHGDPAAALDLIEESIAPLPDFPNFLLYRGLARLGVGDAEAVIEISPQL